MVISDDFFLLLLLGSSSWGSDDSAGTSTGTAGDGISLAVFSDTEAAGKIKKYYVISMDVHVYLYFFFKYTILDIWTEEEGVTVVVWGIYIVVVEGVLSL